MGIDSAASNLYTYAMISLHRVLLIGCGTMALALATIGIFVPILPTTPLVLLAAFCFARSSPRFYHWLVHNRWFGAYLRHYREGRGMALRVKVIALAGLWATIGLTMLMAVASPWGRLALLAVALAVTAHLARVKTLREGAEQARHPGDALAEVEEG